MGLTEAQKEEIKDYVTRTKDIKEISEKTKLPVDDIRKYLIELGVEIYRTTILPKGELFFLVGVSQNTINKAIKEEEGKLGREIEKPPVEVNDEDIKEIEEAVRKGKVKGITENEGILELGFQERIRKLEMVIKARKYLKDKVMRMIPEDVYNKSRNLTKEELEYIAEETGYKVESIRTIVSRERYAREEQGEKSSSAPKEGKRKVDLLSQINVLRTHHKKTVAEIAEITGEELETVYYYLGKLGRPLWSDEYGIPGERRSVMLLEKKIASEGITKTPKELAKEFGISVNTICYVLGNAEIPMLTREETAIAGGESREKIEEIVARMREMMGRSKSEFIELLNSMIDDEEVLPEYLREKVIDIRNGILADSGVQNLEALKGVKSTKTEESREGSVMEKEIR